MIIQFCALKKLIREITATETPASARIENPDYRENLNKECHHLKMAVYEKFKISNGGHPAVWELNIYHAAVIRLCDEISSRSAAPDESGQYCLYCLTDLLNSNEIMYKSFLQDHYAPQIYVTAIKELMKSALGRITENLRKKKVPAWMIREIESGLKTRGSRTFPRLSMDDYKYLKLFIGELERLSGDPRNKDWQQRILFFLLHFNFNHLGVFNHWKRSLSHRFRVSGSDRSLSIIEEWKQLLLHSAENAGLAYDRNPGSLSLKQHMLLFLEEEQKQIERRIQNESLVIQLSTNMSVNALCLEFHYKHRLKLLNYNKKIEAARDFAAVHRSKERNQVSPKSISRIDLPKLKNEAIGFHRILKAMDEQVRKDFNLDS